MANRKILISLLVIASLFISCGNKTPVIISIDPKIGNMGEIITLSGSNFGESRDESYVSIAGTAPTNSSYYLWQNDKIIVRVPEMGESGLVHVHAKGKKSNGVLFSNSASVPRPVDGDDFGLEPKIAAIIPQIGAPGTLINITGNNFGVTRENAGVFFSWDYDSGTVNPYVVREPEFIEVSEIEQGYEYWSARELRVRLPDGAVSGNLEIRTPHGSSRSIFFDVSGRPGYKNLKDKKIYTVTYSVDIKVLEATRPNTLYLWIPKPISSPSQRNVSLVSRSAEPFVENHRGVSLYKLDNLGAGSNLSINLSYRVEVYAVETGIRPLSLRQETTALVTTHTQSSVFIPSDSQKIKSVVSTIARNEQNPYTKAKAIYDWILANIQISDSPHLSDSVEDALEKRRSDPYTTALLYTAMTRAANIPCIPVAGVYIDRSGQTFRHYWTEFWIDGFGWLPVDPAMGSGAVFDTSSAMQEPMNEKDVSNYYFGSIDNQRIAFSRGELVLSQMENKGRLVSHPQSYSLQNIWEESAGGLESYSSLWGDITISGIYQ
ncbi:MAG: IPT/TIG domain-containing protein [Treponema sp.]|nr:IPT/TIG domain-containing protein [Treponema sp.]